MEWREKVDSVTKDHLELQIRSTHKNEEALKSAEDPINAQLWLAIANLSRQIHSLESKLDYLEKALQDINKEKMKKTSSQENKEIKKAMKKIMSGKNK